MPRQLPSKFSIRGFRRSLASLEAVPQFAIMGVFSGLVTGLVILAFRTLIEIPLATVLNDDFENFEALTPALYFLVPVAGAVILAIFMSLLKPDHRRVGPVHVLERLARHQGHMPYQNALVQFFGGIIALASGQSGGREGPAIHLGAAGASLLGQKLKLPNNSIRVLVGCGAAAAISASFNTPMAGVIFSMEVILMEYTIAGFIPVILAAVTATLINQSVYGAASAFDVPAALSMSSIFEVPFLLLEGVAIGSIAAFFILAVSTIHKYAPNPIWLRILLAGFVTGTLALVAPQILGVGYDTVNSAMDGSLTLSILVIAFIFKILASTVTIALGMPIGVIGPALFIGAVAGGILGHFGNYLMPDHASSQGLYVILGMGAMMGAVLQAPLASLMAVMELTNNSNIILPAMLVIIVANMTSRQLFGVESIFTTQMKILGLETEQKPLSQALNRASVASIMSRSFERTKSSISRDQARILLLEKPVWLLVDDAKGPSSIVRSEDLLNHLAASKDEQINLNKIPATRFDVKPILIQATLSEALDMLNSSGVQGIYVNRITAPLMDSVVGIVTRSDIESYYQI
jgi:CIC family chloride channel protein